MTTDLFDPLAEEFGFPGTNGRAVVLVHGFTGVPAHFRPMAAMLHAEGFTVVAPRLEGHGTTIEDMARTGRDDWVDSVRVSVRAVAVDHDEVHLVGLSMGGLISIIVAAEDGAASITTINSPLVFRNKRIYLAGLVHRFRPEVQWEEQPQLDIDDEVAAFSLTYPGFPTRASSDLLSISREARRAAHQISCRALVIQSLVDETVDPRSAVKLMQAFGDRGQLLWLERSRHNALLDRERRTIEGAVREHLGEDSDVAADIVPSS